LSSTAKKKNLGSGWYMTVILALRKKRQEDRKFEAMLGYIETVLKNNQKKHN
jgi:hypothetical protein